MRIDSPEFMWTCILAAVVIGIVGLLWRNTIWTPRGITPTNMVQGLQGQKKIWWAIGGFALIALLVFGAMHVNFESPSAKTVWAWVKRYWLWILVASIVVWYFAGRLQSSGLRFAAVIVLLLCFIVFPFISAATPDATEAAVRTVVCDDVTSHETHTCLLDGEWSTWVKNADGIDSGAKHLCFSNGVEHERKAVNGVNFVRFRSTSGEIVNKYRLFPPGTDCSTISL